jgi:hypothetical protein
MLLAMLRLHPSNPQPFYSPCWLNGRRYLASPSYTDLEREYTPVCMSFAPIIFTDLGSLVVERESGKEEEELRRVLVATVEQANEGYKALRGAGSVLTEFAGIAEEIGRGLRRFVMHYPSPLTLNILSTRKCKSND